MQASYITKADFQSSEHAENLIYNVLEVWKKAAKVQV
jgi:hypothetical protein